METRHGFRRSCCSPVTAATGRLISRPCMDFSIKILLQANPGFRESDAGLSIHSGMQAEKKAPFGTSFRRGRLRANAYPISGVAKGFGGPDPSLKPFGELMYVVGRRSRKENPGFSLRSKISAMSLCWRVSKHACYSSQHFRWSVHIGGRNCGRNMK